MAGMVSRPGLEPGTLCLKGRCSNQLSYRPIKDLQTNRSSTVVPEHRVDSTTLRTDTSNDWRPYTHTVTTP